MSVPPNGFIAGYGEYIPVCENECLGSGLGHNGGGCDGVNDDRRCGVVGHREVWDEEEGMGEGGRGGSVSIPTHAEILNDLLTI